MIKRFVFATRKPDSSFEDFAALWPGAMSGGGQAPEPVRPIRIVVCTSLPAVLADPLYDGVGIETFVDEHHLESFLGWLQAPEAESASTYLDEVIDTDASPVQTADELVLRGADWLDQRWRHGGDKIKHMAIARRAEGLTREAFSERWKGRAGFIAKADGPTVAIPDEARGKAYIQNHPRPESGGTYDAVNEVYFDDVETLGVRIDWYRENVSNQAETDLVSAAWFVAVREELVWPR